MVHIFKQQFEYNHPWSQVTLAIFLKYPNPFASHVLASDVIDRYIDADTGKNNNKTIRLLILSGILHTTRLFLKKGSVPRWGQAVTHFNNNIIILVYEQPRNIHHRTFTSRPQKQNHDFNHQKPVTQEAYAR